MKIQYLFLATSVVMILLFTLNTQPSVYITMLFSIFLVLLTLYGVIRILAHQTLSHGVIDFIIGDEGSLSLSRLQAVLWGLTILSSQIAIIATLLKFHSDGLQYFQLVFSESSIWLLGLSLASYISVKGITVNRVNQHHTLYKRVQPRPSDLIMGSNGLDFSRCQMLIWTFIGLGIFSVNLYYFLECLKVADNPTIVALFENHYEEYSEANKAESILFNGEKLPFLPYLPWTFVVLMGLSQGSYVGKKLVPAFKLDDVKEIREKDLEANKKQLEIKRNRLIQLSKFQVGAFSLSETDTRNQEMLMNEIRSTEKKIQESIRSIRDIEILRHNRV